jgi:acetyltransferase
VPAVLLSPEQFDSATGALAEVLIDCVDGGASVGFLAPLSRADAVAWWSESLRAPGTLTWVDHDPQGAIAACVQLLPASMPNGRHRAQVAKLLVHRRARGLGLAGRLMSALEAEAVRRGRTLLLLDTQTGSVAESVYLRWGWVPFGTVPDHAQQPDGRLADTTYMLRRLTPD